MENKIINYINQTPENTNPSVLATLLGELKVPKPLTYDYMPEGYPSKRGWSIEWDGNTEGLVPVSGPDSDTFFKVSDLLPTDDELIGSTGELSDGKKFEITSDLVHVISEDITFVNYAVFVKKDNTTSGGFTFPQKGTYFVWTPEIYVTKLSKQTITPIAEEFLPNTTAGGVTTLHINVTAVNMETMEATFTADKTPVEMLQASANGPVWCVVSFAAGIMAEEAVSIGLPPAWLGGAPAFGLVIWKGHEDDGNNQIIYAVKGGFSGTWVLDFSAFQS